jgi:hypothetical protein
MNEMEESMVGKGLSEIQNYRSQYTQILFAFLYCNQFIDMHEIASIDSLLKKGLSKYFSFSNILARGKRRNEQVVK